MDAQTERILSQVGVIVFLIVFWSVMGWLMMRWFS
jgi:hypothetical protein